MKGQLILYPTCTNAIGQKSLRGASEVMTELKTIMSHLTYINMLKCRHVSSRTVTSFFLSDFPPLETKLLGLPVFSTNFYQYISLNTNLHSSPLQAS